MQIKKIAIIYDDSIFKYTTAFYCKQALLKMGYRVDYYSPDDVYNIPKTYDLYLNVDENARYIIPTHLRPSAYWVIDTHMDYDWRLRKARMFDFVFATQKNGADRLKSNGIKNVYWLPLACDPDIHKKHEVPKEFDMSFVGNISHSRKRIQYLNFLKAKLKDKKVFIGKAAPEESAMIYSKSKLVFNLSVEDDINMRVFETLSCGSLLLTNDLGSNGQKELFGERPPFIVYKSKRDLLNKIKYYISHEGEREGIARNAMVEAINKHTYVRRMKEILRKVEEVGPNLKYDDYTEDISIMGNIYGKVFSLISEKKSILDIGCATGRFSKYLVGKKNCFVTGIEKDARLSEKAKRVLPEVILADATEEDAYNQTKVKYDYILLMDILEHTSKPEFILSRVKDLLGNSGKIIITTPNIAYWAARRDLLLGRFNYLPEGYLMDNDHVHFFTYDSLRKLINDCGYIIKYFDILYGFPILNDNHRAWRKVIRANFISRFLANTAMRFPNIFAHQLLLVIEKSTR